MPRQKANYPIMGISEPSGTPLIRELFGKIKMQSYIQTVCVRQLRRPLGILHENHRTDRRDPLFFSAREGRIGLRLRATPIVGIDDEHLTCRSVGPA